MRPFACLGSRLPHEGRLADDDTLVSGACSGKEEVFDRTAGCRREVAGPKDEIDDKAQHFLPLKEYGKLRYQRYSCAQCVGGACGGVEEVVVQKKLKAGRNAYRGNDTSTRILRHNAQNHCKA